MNIPKNNLHLKKETDKMKFKQIFLNDTKKGNDTGL